MNHRKELLRVVAWGWALSEAKCLRKAQRPVGSHIQGPNQNPKTAPGRASLLKGPQLGLGLRV